MQIYRDEPVIEHLHRQGERLRRGRARGRPRATASTSTSRCWAAPATCSTARADRTASRRRRSGRCSCRRSIRRGVIVPSFVVSYSHTDDDIDRTIEAVDGALEVYARALSDGVEKFLVGRPSRHVFERR